MPVLVTIPVRPYSANGGCFKNVIEIESQLSPANPYIGTCSYTLSRSSYTSILRYLFVIILYTKLCVSAVYLYLFSTP